jgi:hypothetical protein
VFAYDMASSKQGRTMGSFVDHVDALILAINVIIHIPLHEMCTKKCTKHTTL